MSEVLVVASKVKKMVKEQGMRTGGDAIEKLSQMVEARVKAGVEKAKAAGKKTVQAIDVE
jgi:histone H3/H4